MKKLFAIALALVMVLGIASSALAVTWAAPTVSANASAPFSAEVIKLGANAGVTGFEYYTVINDAAAYNYSNIFYAIKLNLPSVAQANAAYAGANYHNGQEIKVTINYTNVSGKTSDVKYVTIGSSAKTLWYNGTTNTFEESWVPSVTNACGCGDQHVIRATASGSGEVKIKVCFADKGKLSDMKIAGCYSVEEKKFCGIKPCPNCTVTDVNGYKFSGECSKFDIFFSTNSAGKVLGAYVIDRCADYTQDTYGSMTPIKKLLYGWQYSDKTCPTCTDCVGSPVLFELQELPYESILTDNWQKWDNSTSFGGYNKIQMAQIFKGSCGVLGSTATNRGSANIKASVVFDDPATVAGTNFGDFDRVYLKNDNGTFTPVSAANLGDIQEGLVAGSNLYFNGKTNENILTRNAIVNAPITSWVGATDDTHTNVYTLNEGKTASDGLLAKFDSGRFMTGAKGTTKTDQKNWSLYPNADKLVYGRIYYFCYNGTDDVLFAQLTADRFNCDTNDGSYLNAINFLYSVLGFTFADIQAGNVYMTDDILLSNFGFLIAPCNEAVWGAYTAAITVAPVAEVPATGSATFLGFLFIGLSAVAAVANRKRSNEK